MKIDLNRLVINDRIEFDEDFSFDLEVYNNKEIKDLKNLHVKGYVYYNSAEVLEIKLNLTGIMIVTDSVTLEDIEHTIDSEIVEEYSLNDTYFKEYYEKEQNILDILAILWENIVLEIPIGLTRTENAKLSGEGWSLGENENKEDNIDPRLAELRKLLD